MPGTHEGRVQRHQDERVLLLSLHQFANRLQQRFVEIELGELELRPVRRLLQKLLPRVGLLELDFQKIHVGVVEEFEMSFGRCRPTLVIVAEVQEERGGGVVRRTFSGQPAKHPFPLVDGGRSSK